MNKIPNINSSIPPKPSFSEKISQAIGHVYKLIRFLPLLVVELIKKINNFVQNLFKQNVSQSEFKKMPDVKQKTHSEISSIEKVFQAKKPKSSDIFTSFDADFNQNSNIMSTNRQFFF